MAVGRGYWSWRHRFGRLGQWQDLPVDSGITCPAAASV